ncbi:RNA polymerase sigma factor [Longitalea luteola]|uniref:RNA polymerase sigma factor n=1 Tax=Longitalea luteola TaxID=2812563 RepID=UPI001A961E13|nr:RNA polymerase sigma-70 factor [Longitalea luteola]
MEAVVIHTDEILLSQVAGGDKDAFTMLYRRYWHALFTTAAKALRSKTDAADLVQDIFLSIWNRRHDLRITGSLAAYLQTSVKYSVIKYIEKNITRRDYLVLLTDMLVHYQPPDVESQLQIKELQTVIQSAVDQMPQKMREVYQLSRKHHLSHKEIAERLGISDETVKKHIQHALHIIKTSISHNATTLAVLLIQWLK